MEGKLRVHFYAHPRAFAWVCFVLSFEIPTVFAQDKPVPMHHTFGGQLIFWSSALVIIVVMARIIFKEQLHERKTLNRLIKEIGPFYPEFDIDQLKHWVLRAAPPLWRGWSSGDMSVVEPFATDEFISREADHFNALSDAERVRHLKFGSVLKVHPLGLYMFGPGPAPRDVELMLRLEVKAIDFTSDRSELVDLDEIKFEQLQYFWTMRHTGTHWELHQVWPADTDATDLDQRPPVPVVSEWVRQENRFDA